MEQIYLALHPPILAFLRATARGEAEDLAQDTFLALARALPRFEGDAQGLRALAFTIARRRAQDAARRRTRRRTDPVPASDLDAGRAPDDVETQALARLGEAAALRLVGLLPPAQAQAVLLRVLGGLSVEEAAKAMGKRPGAVRALQHRALRRLARQLQDENDLAP